MALETVPAASRRPARLTSLLSVDPAGPAALRNTPLLIGVLEGTGIGPTVIDAALQVLHAVEQTTGLTFEVCRGGLIGEDAVQECGAWLPESTADFCADIFRRGGAILSGPGGGRYVYDLRRRFDLFCKFVPVQPVKALARAGRLFPALVENMVYPLSLHDALAVSSAP